MDPRSTITPFELRDYSRVPKRVLWDAVVDLAAQLYGCTPFEDLIKDNQRAAARRRKILLHVQRICAKHAGRPSNPK